MRPTSPSATRGIGHSCSGRISGSTACGPCSAWFFCNFCDSLLLKTMLGTPPYYTVPTHTRSSGGSGGEEQWVASLEPRKLASTRGQAQKASINFDQREVKPRKLASTLTNGRFKPRTLASTLTNGRLASTLTNGRFKTRKLTSFLVLNLPLVKVDA